MLVQNGEPKIRGGRRCSKLQIGSKNSECPSTQHFAENRIDFSVLPDLTDQDLEKLGVVLGDRRKILRAIANLETSMNVPAANRRHRPFPPGGQLWQMAQRRQSP